MATMLRQISSLFYLPSLEPPTATTTTSPLFVFYRILVLGLLLFYRNDLIPI